MSRSARGTSFGLDCFLACEGFPSHRGDVDVSRIDLDSVADPAGPLGGNERAATSEKEVAHHIARLRAVLYRSFNEGQRLHRRVEAVGVLALDLPDLTLVAVAAPVVLRPRANETTTVRSGAGNRLFRGQTSLWPR